MFCHLFPRKILVVHWRVVHHQNHSCFSTLYSLVSWKLLKRGTAFTHERLFYQSVHILSQMFLRWKTEDPWYFTLLLSNKCQMPTHNSFTYTHCHSKTFFYLTPNFHFDLISLSDSIHSFYQFRNQTHWFRAFQSSLSLTEPGLFWCKTQSSKPWSYCQKGIVHFFHAFTFSHFFLIPPLYQISDLLNLLLIDPNGCPDRRRSLLFFFHLPVEV